MLKKDAIKLFDNVTGLAAALEVTHPSISVLPDVLPLRYADRIRGAAIRLKKPLPRHMRDDSSDHNSQ